MRLRSWLVVISPRFSSYVPEIRGKALLIAFISTIAFVELIESLWLRILFGTIAVVSGSFGLAPFYWRLSRPWRRVHFPFMVQYSFVSSAQQAITELVPGELFEISRALQATLHSLYPKRSPEECRKVVERAKLELRSFSDKEETRRRLINRGATVNRAEEIVKGIEAKRQREENKAPLLIRYVIAEIIRERYGEDERMNYLWAVYSGKAF